MEKLALVSVLFGLAFGSDVLDLSDGSFEAEVGRHDLLLAEFFAPWCGHCKKLAPEYETAATALLKEDPPVALAKVDCTDEKGGKETCGKYGVSGYPTLKIFRNGELSSDYDGPRSSAGIVADMRKKSGPMAKEIKSVEDMKKAVEGLNTVVAGFFAKDSKEKAGFVQAATNLFANYKLVYSLSEEINKEFGYADSDAVVIFRPSHLQNKFEEAKLKMTDSISRSNVEKFVKKNGMGLCGHMTPDNKDVFNKPLVVAYYDVDYKKNAKGTNYWRNRVMKVGKTYADKDLTFAVASNIEFHQELESLGIDKVADPVVAAWAANGDKFKMEDKFTVAALAAFVGKFLAGELAAHVKSEPIPEPNDGPVKVVVGSNFKDIVMDDTKDVLIEFYAPWCGHCKSLEPKYTELGEKLEGVEHVVIAKMDATANDAPSAYQVSGFPTIYWAPAGKKSSPQKYQGGREVDEFIAFIKKESTKPVDLGGKTKTSDEL